MYNLNTIAPFAQDRMSGYDSMVPYYTPFNKAQNNYYTVYKKYRNDG